MRIVDDIGAVSGQQDQPREVRRQRHGPQHRLGGLGPGCEIERGIEAGRGVVRRRRAVESQRIAHELADIDRSRRLDEGEGGDGGELEAAPGALRARLEPRRTGRPSRLRARRSSDVRPGLSSTGKPQFLRHRSAKRRCAVARPKKPAKPRVWICGFTDSSARRNTSERTSMQKAA